MAQETSQAVCRKCRRAGEKLFLKGEKCFTHKCIFERRPHPPGALESQRKHRSTVSEYGSQLREKQKIKNSYGLREQQFVNYVRSASGKRGADPAKELFASLESRLDRVVYRLGLASSQAMARQMVGHGHVLVNGKRTTIPSYRLRSGDIISIRGGSKDSVLFGEAIKTRAEKQVLPAWLVFDSKKFEGSVRAHPSLDATVMPYDLKAVIEFYSR
ncbi:MAG: 30S ribosomal protein S4 [Candidatus Lloydbacteria bacterium]|nr:30S ribosomal protein S4 [Candidatus Lloydbacteria bacterium]